MSDLIRREDAIEAVRKELVCDGRHEAHDKTCRFIADVLLSSLPSAEADRPTGEWLVGDAWPHNVYCSNCYATFVQEGWSIWKDGRLPRNFCPNCGAKMGGDGE